MTYSVGISTFNRNDDLRKCLVSLRAQTTRDFSIVVANGGDPAAVRRTTAEFPDLRITVVDQERKGIVEARNLGWRRSQADVVCLIDDDLVVHPQWMAQVQATFASDARIGGVSGPTLIPRERQANRDLAAFLEEFKRSRNPFFRLTGAVYQGLVLEHKEREVGRILRSGAFTPGSNYEECLRLPGIVEVDYLEACHMCFRRELFERLGGFSYDYTGTGEWNEPDFSFRVRRLGYKLVFNPRAVTEHHISQSGVFKARTNAYERSWNFIHFYFRNVKLDSPDKMLRFGVNLAFINGYWCYKFLQSKNPDWLSGVTGTVMSLAREIYA